jgi:hypothetical protein
MTTSLGGGKHWLDEHIDRAAARAAAEMHFQILGRRFAVRARLDADQARPPLAQRLTRRPLDRAPGAAAADPAGDRAVSPDQRLGAGLAAAAASVRITVASTNGSPARISSAMLLTTSS